MNKFIKPISILFVSFLLTGCAINFGPGGNVSSEESSSEPSSKSSQESSSQPSSETTQESSSQPTSQSPTIITSSSQISSSSSSAQGKEGYYANVDLTKTGQNLLIELNKLMLDTHSGLITYAAFTSYTKGNNKSFGMSIDQVSENEKLNEMFYTGNKISFSTSYSKEHVWPCAKSNGLWSHNSGTGQYYVDGTGYVGGGSDLYHIRPCDGVVNTMRGSSMFKEFTASEKASAVKGSDGGPYVLLGDASEFSDFCEPADQFKGDIARILMYVHTHYSSIGSYYTKTGWVKYVRTLPLTNVMYGSESAVKATLKKWNNLDPVSETEKLRNDIVQKIQGNRNPYVDYPELLNKALS